MPKDYGRHERIAGAVQRGLAQLLSSEVNDPRVAGLTVTEVQVTADCRHANVFVTRMTSSGDKKLSDEDVENILDGIGRASGFLRSRLAKVMDLRRCPELHFEYDFNVQRASDLTALIDSVQPEEEQD
ncbi:MAG: 30S ribosome-binding factor RbfA [Proteobacteria bacterium]|jgi:ribosome-binding factor A|nr:30S ribosome-binding factor RbfA [Pseudomonadota bacterium]